MIAVSARQLVLYKVKRIKQMLHGLEIIFYRRDKLICGVLGFWQTSAINFELFEVS
jgi:hypothetical protein